MSKSTRAQNLTGNRYHAPRDADYEEQLANNLASRILAAGNWDSVDLDNLKQQFPGLWHRVCEKTRERRKEGASLERQLRSRCNQRESDRLKALAA